MFKRILFRLSNTNISDWPFLFERYIVSSFYRLFNLRLSSHPYISGDTYAKISNKRYYGKGRIDVDQNDIIYMSAYSLDNFITEVLPGISCKFVLITHHSDSTIDEKYLDFVNDNRLIHWFAQNSLLSSKKVTSLPIGLEDRWRHNNGITADFNKLRLKNIKKIPKILYGFSEQTNPEVRRIAKSELELCSMSVEVSKLSRKYRQELAKYMFVASPAGNGIDCHRTWEALYLKTIPIVVGKDFYSGFENFPGIVLDSWKDIHTLDESTLRKMYLECLERLNNCEYINNDFWKAEIKAKAYA